MGLFTTTPRAAPRTLRVLARLVGYPGRELRANLPLLREALHAEGALGASRLAELDALLAQLARSDPLDAEADYVQLFDSGRRTSLHLFEHVHGDSRDRGPAMIDLARTYEKAGLYLAAGELPDYLPLVLEFLSLCPADEARALLTDAAPVLHVLSERLEKRDSAYAAVFNVLGALGDTRPDTASLAELRREKTADPDDLAALDRAWEEAEVRFGSGDAQDGCPRASAMMAKRQSRSGVRP